MNNSIRILAAVTAAIMCAATLASCKNGNTTSGESYSYNSKSGDTTDSAVADPEKKINVNTSWQGNFRITYDYYNATSDEDTVKIVETRNDNAFTAEYPDGGSTLYYVSHGNDTDYYVIVDSEGKAVHSLLKNSRFSDISTTFMKLSTVSSSMPSLSNVMYMYDENVAGRVCHKYVQRAYTGGEVTETVYIWIDSEYGFAAKCESYDSSDTLRVKWETKSFETGSVGENDISVDFSKYTVVEEEETE
jgi:hypothetical protein